MKKTFLALFCFVISVSAAEEMPQNRHNLEPIEESTNQLNVQSVELDENVSADLLQADNVNSGALKHQMDILTLSNEFDAFNQVFTAAQDQLTDEMKANFGRIDQEIGVIQSTLEMIISDFETQNIEQADAINQLEHDFSQFQTIFSESRAQLKGELMTQLKEVDEQVMVLKSSFDQTIGQLNKELNQLQEGLTHTASGLTVHTRTLVLLTLLLLGVSGGIYWFLNRRFNGLEGILGSNSILEKLLPQLEKGVEQEEPDHDFTLKMADEITRLHKNINRMDEKTKGLKSIVKGVERIQANLHANGYEITNLLGQSYDEGMVIDVVNFVHSDELEKDTQIITKVIKPQVVFNGKLIQRAQVEVTQN